jgi:cyclopropane-fatty-acyl-phospholipid synthase
VSTISHRGAVAQGRGETAVESVADTLGPGLTALLGPPAVQIEFWDGSTIGPSEGPGLLRINSLEALRRIIWSPDELGLARAFVAGDIDAIGPVPEILRALQANEKRSPKMIAAAAPSLVAGTRRLGGVGSAPPARPPEEMVPRGRRHSIRRDKKAISHHYDVGNDFYELLLGPAMTYSCARFTEATESLESAQAAKHELICRKLGLHEAEQRAGFERSRPRLLDVGCGWGSMAIHAATHHDVDVVGITISDEQAAYARRRVSEAGLDDRVEIRIQDYREVDDGPFDAISSIGMSEHVGSEQIETYFAQLHDLLRPGGRLLNHAISSVGGSRLKRRSFIYRYVFPDGELLDIADSTRSMERAGFEIRDIENLREHYAQTLRCWVSNLQTRWDEATAMVGERRARVWLLYMSGSINGFDDAGLQLHQALGVRNAPDGTSDMPRTRRGWD